MKRILLAYDGGEPAKRALETAATLAKKLDGLVSVISVVPFHAGRIGMDIWDDPEVHERELEEARSLLALQGIEAELIEPVGEPAHTIERIARDGGFDTIVVGSRGLGAISRLLQGSVSGHVATHADATVVVVR
ncbi:MAG TPA: universal stress protein [Candidatus Limnocylindrales bacterium]|jgi:nucleotide-binding universal stress UspA family protein|nr:universal stress protein [Candidatus Limnocylindrales bacterium]